MVTNGIEKPSDWKTVGDEPYLMSKKLTGVPLVVDKNRSRGGRYLVKKYNPEIILLDDGFQHRKLHRDIDIALLDTSISVGLNYWREPFSALKRTNFILLTKATEENLLKYWKERISSLNKPAYSIKNTIEDLIIGLKEGELSLDQIKGKSVITFSGIANHESFNNTVKQLGCEVLQSISFKDHHHYSSSDKRYLERQYSELQPDFLLTTEKDLFKLASVTLPIFALTLRMDISNELVDYIEKIIQQLD